MINGSYLVRFIIVLEMEGIQLNIFSSGSWLDKDTQLARNKKGSSFLLFSTHLFTDPSNAVCRNSDFKLLLTVSLFIV